MRFPSLLAVETSFYKGGNMRQAVVKRICKLILRYCYDDISDVQHIKYFCDKILKDKETQTDIDLSRG